MSRRFLIGLKVRVRRARVRVGGRVRPREPGRTGLCEESGWVRARAAALCGVRLGVGDVR